MTTFELGQMVYVRLPVTVEEIHEERGNRSGLTQWLVVRDELGNEFSVDYADVEAP